MSNPDDTLRDTDPADLRPEAVTFEALVSEVQGQRLELLAISSKLDRIYDAILNVVSRVEKLEDRQDKMETTCRYRHSNGHGLPTL